LLRIDKSIIADPMIANEFHHASKQANRARFQRLVKAFRSPSKKMSEKQVRISLAGMISNTARRLNVELTAPEIRELFDAFAALYRKKPMTIDHHFPERKDTLSREIFNSRLNWDFIFDPEKFRA